MRYEVSLFCEEFVAKGPPLRVLALHATLILDAADSESAGTAAVSTLLSDPQLTALGAAPPAVEVDEVTELLPGATPHGPILCFFQLPPPAD